MNVTVELSNKEVAEIMDPSGECKRGARPAAIDGGHPAAMTPGAAARAAPMVGLWRRTALNMRD
jgi:hypothetical protein